MSTLRDAVQSQSEEVFRADVEAVQRGANPPQGSEPNAASAESGSIVNA